MPILEICGLLVLAGVGWFWLDSLRARDIAVSAARRACDAQGMQFLDESVSVSRVRPARDEDAALVLRRVYSFEYSDTGNNRHPGSIVLLGRRVEFIDVGIGEYQIPTLH